ncbi:hypothetical protein [Microbacterium sp.]|uniref:hypothetical protein n=1 Tax=Microbacterium sp. TaxID=51671 RepID=UPI0025D3F60B|nr:hypothetical protein [Microbacterium sp.]MBT9605464.1 hypothetical protein [Microbacterium sp.]
MDANPRILDERLFSMERMGGQYSIDVAGFLSTTDSVATALESLGQAVSEALTDLDHVVGLVATEADLTSAVRSATAERRRIGPAAVQHGGAVVTAAGRVALTYVQADDDMASITSRAEASATLPQTPGTGRREALAQ